VEIHAVSRRARDIRIAGDVGGTFTDLVLIRDSTNEVYTTKTKSTPDDLARGFIAGILKLLDAADYSPEDVTNVLFTSTATTNAVLELSGARVGLIVTRGFRHILEIARANIPGRLTNELMYNRPERLVPMERIREVDERSLADGAILRPLDEDGARQAIRELLDQDVECIAVALLHSYANPRHEARIRELIAEECPAMLVSVSSEVVPAYREYERTMTTVLNSYVMPVMERAIKSVRSGLREAGLDPALGVVRCDGGIMSADAVTLAPVHTVLSGPAAGVYGAAYVARLAGYDDIVSLDMGGTSTDVSLATGGRARIRGDAMVSEYPVKIPIMDIVTIGAGGGSIAYVSSSGALHVGPRSAGSNPGPVCYDLGGEEITVTDANLVLGRLSPDLAGGEIVVNRDKAYTAMECLARQVGLGPLELAQGILTIVNEKMLGALRVVSVQRGYDPRDFVLIPFGGAGPMHSGDLSRLLGMRRTLIPPTPGVLSAVGALVSDITCVFSKTILRPVEHVQIDIVNESLAHLTRQAEDWLESEGVASAERQIRCSAELRYAGQASEVSVTSFPSLTPERLEQTVDEFHHEHRRLYGFDWRGTVPVELVAFKITGIGLLQKSQMLAWGVHEGTPDDARTGYRPVFFDGQFVDTACYQRQLLAPGSTVLGPAIIEQTDCTSVVLPGQRATVDRLLNLVVEER
jgi:N-methylhydantoinase A